MEPKTVTIAVEEYTELLDSHALLMALESHGVDNWHGYSYAVEECYGGGADDDE